MAVFLSLQGCMAAGKTTAARYVEEHLKNVFVSYENPALILRIIRERGYDQNTPQGFVEIQRLFIRAEIERRESCNRYDYVLMDLGADEIEFFTLFYPKSRGFDWDIKTLLKEELKALGQCAYAGTLFLDAAAETLIQNKQADLTRKRGSFEHYLANLYQDKKEWFSARPNTDFIKVDGLSKEQIGQQTIEWVKGFMMKPSEKKDVNQP